jgi:hypothetical protein
MGFPQGGINFVCHLPPLPHSFIKAAHRIGDAPYVRLCRVKLGYRCG